MVAVAAVRRLLTFLLVAAPAVMVMASPFLRRRHVLTFTGRLLGFSL